MTRKNLRVALLSSGLIALAVSQATAHYLGYVGGVHRSSLTCDLGIKGVGNLETGEALVTCKVTQIQLETKCINPGGKEVLGTAAFGNALVGEKELSESDATGKGKAMSEVPVISDLLDVCTPEIACANPNWSVAECLVVSSTVEHKVFKCDGDGDCDEIDTETDTPNSTLLQDCVIPPGFDVNNPPPIGTNYNCTTIEADHLL